MHIFIHGSLDTGVTQQLLKYLRLHSALDCTGGVGMSQRVHTEAFDSILIANFVKMGIKAAIFAGFPCPKTDKDQICHNQCTILSSAPVSIGQRLIQPRRLFPKFLGCVNR